MKTRHLFRHIQRTLASSAANSHLGFWRIYVEWLEDGGVRAHPTYRQAGWHAEAPWRDVQVRKRVGMRHHPLAEILNGFAAAPDWLSSTWPDPVPGRS